MGFCLLCMCLTLLTLLLLAFFMEAGEQPVRRGRVDACSGLAGLIGWWGGWMCVVAASLAAVNRP
jgi:hypothetical protein